jgi:hypothetical protein
VTEGLQAGSVSSIPATLSPDPHDGRGGQAEPNILGPDSGAVACWPQLTFGPGSLQREPALPPGRQDNQGQVPTRCPVCGKLEGDCGSFCRQPDDVLRLAFMRAHKGWAKACAPWLLEEWATK